MAAGAYSVEVPSCGRVVVGLPPAKKSGMVQYDRIFLSLASDFEGAKVRLAIGKPGAWRIENDLAVPAGRKVLRELVAGDEVASIVHNGGQPVSVLVEYQGL